MPNYKCTSCAKFASVVDGVRCKTCKGLFHPLCAKGYDPKTTKAWYCRACKSPPTVAHTTDPNLSPSDSFLDANLDNSSPNPLSEEIKLLREVITGVHLEMQSFRKEISLLNANIAESNKRMDTVELRMAAIEERQNTRACAPSPDPAVTELIKQLRLELNEREQENLANDVQITGLPEDAGENVMQLVSLLAKKIGCDIDERDIVSVARKGAKRAPAVSGDQRRPRPIVIRLTRKTVRDNILRAARVRRDVDSAGITSGPPQRVYCNEHLSQSNRTLFYRAREEGRRHNWRYVWTRGGFIYVRRDPGSMAHRIRSDHDLDKIFGSGAVGLTQ